jgi:hypothetical protein
MNRTFDFYEYAGVIIPGAVVVLALLWLFPEARPLFAKEGGVTFGELGIFVIVAYATGQLVQGIGNAIEWIWSKITGGMPSSRVFDGDYFAPDQYRRLVELLQTRLQIQNPSDLRPHDRRAVVREVYAYVLGAGKMARVDTFNGNYGLLRGLCAAFVVVFAAALVLGKGPYVISATIICFCLAVQRMHRFSKHYATELFPPHGAMRFAYCAVRAPLRHIPSPVSTEPEPVESGTLFPPSIRTLTEGE